MHSICPFLVLLISWFPSHEILKIATGFIIPLPKTNTNSRTNVCSSTTINPNRQQCPYYNNVISSSRTRIILKLRNFDLPEAIILYGTNSFVAPSIVESGANDTPTNKNKKSLQLKEGVLRLLKEANDIGSTSRSCAIILLSECYTVAEIQENIVHDDKDSDMISSFISSGLLTIVSSKELGNGLGYSPSPGALLDSIALVEVQPQGFGGSSGFGTKNADPPRSPLPKHCVVILNGEDTQTTATTSNTVRSNIASCRNRISAGRMAGMRVIYIEGHNPTFETPYTNEIEQLADAIIPSLGGEDDWDIITLDSISTPGSYWLNPPNPRDDNGDRIYAEDVVYTLEQERLNQYKQGGSDVEEVDMGEDISLGNEDYISSILADIDPL